MSLVDFAPYGVRRSQHGWRRSTSYHPYDLLEGTSEEKLRVTASGTGKRLVESNGDGHKHNSDPSSSGTGSAADNGAAARSGYGGQSRSPFDRVAR